MARNKEESPFIKACEYNYGLCVEYNCKSGRIYISIRDYDLSISSYEDIYRRVEKFKSELVKASFKNLCRAIKGED